MPRKLALVAVLALAACAAGVRRFPLAAPFWRDDDTRPVRARVAAYESADVWDFVDETLFRGAIDTLSVARTGEAVNVNALDEVPDSSWYTNRLARGRLSTTDVVDGSCDAPPPDPAGPWEVTDAKPNGLSPGFFVRTPDGARYLIKPDDARQPERGTASDAIAARVFHVLGYFTPCNRVVALDRAALVVRPGATWRDASGARRPITAAEIEQVLRVATRLPDGRYRVSASRFVAGAPLGPFTFRGVRADDPNDVVPHEDRRELRALRLAAAWLDHYDARAQNTFTSWMPAGDGGYVRHWLLDFSDCFGQAWNWDAMSRRAGHAYSVDFGRIAEDFFALGLVRRPWDHARVDPRASLFGYFRADDFDPEAWREIYPNPAFARMTERDGAWMARMLARLRDEHVRMLVAAGQFSRSAWARYLEATLIARRDRVLARYLTRLSPLADVTLENGALCMTDLGVVAGTGAGVRTYSAAAYRGASGARAGSLAVARTRESLVCVQLPGSAVPDGPPRDDDPARYVIVDVVGAARGRAPLRLHLYDLGPTRGYRLVGLERPDTDAPPP